MKRKRVRDDGSCWVYATLACINKCEHAVPSNRRIVDATPEDRSNDLLLRGVLREKYRFAQIVLKTPDYTKKGKSFFGS